MPIVFVHQLRNATLENMKGRSPGQDSNISTLLDSIKFEGAAMGRGPGESGGAGSSLGEGSSSQSSSLEEEVKAPFHKHQIYYHHGKHHQQHYHKPILHHDVDHRNSNNTDKNRRGVDAPAHVASGVRSRGGTMTTPGLSITSLTESLSEDISEAIGKSFGKLYNKSTASTAQTTLAASSNEFDDSIVFERAESGDSSALAAGDQQQGEGGANAQKQHEAHNLSLWSALTGMRKQQEGASAKKQQQTTKKAVNPAHMLLPFTPEDLTRTPSARTNNILSRIGTSTSSDDDSENSSGNDDEDERESVLLRSKLANDDEEESTADNWDSENYEDNGASALLDDGLDDEQELSEINLSFSVGSDDSDDDEDYDLEDFGDDTFGIEEKLMKLSDYIYKVGTCAPTNESPEERRMLEFEDSSTIMSVPESSTGQQQRGRSNSPRSYYPPGQEEGVMEDGTKEQQGFWQNLFSCGS